LILVVVGGKMITNYFYGGKFIPTELALLITAILIGGSIALSLLRKPAEPVALPTGWVPGSPAERTAEGNGER
jgi:tellurite resistance protein TerC